MLRSENINEKITVIAEAGVNHNGDFNKALELIDVASECGADFIKFQTFNATNIVSASANLAAYQEASTSYKNQLDMLTDLELKYEWHQDLIEYCRTKAIGFITTPFDLEAVTYLAQLEMGLFKIPSGEITNLPFLRHSARNRRRILLSTGMADLGEIEAAINAIVQAGTCRDKITVLHCTTEYPAPMEDVNLRAMANIGRAFGVAVGYSDHTLGIEIPIAAVALGATVIEKHFTLDRGFAGPDHAASLEPNELKAMVQGIRNIEKALAMVSSGRVPVS